MTWTLVAQIGVLALVGCFVAVVGESLVSSYLDKANTRTMKWSDRPNTPERPTLGEMLQPPYPSMSGNTCLCPPDGPGCTCVDGEAEDPWGRTTI